MANFNVNSGNAFRFSVSFDCNNEDPRIVINNKSFGGDVYDITNPNNGIYGNVVVVENSNPIKDPSGDNVLVGLLSYGNNDSASGALFSALGNRIVSLAVGQNFPYTGELLLREQRFSVATNNLIETNYYSFAVSYRGGNTNPPVTEIADIDNSTINIGYESDGSLFIGNATSIDVDPKAPYFFFETATDETYNDNWFLERQINSGSWEIIGYYDSVVSGFDRYIGSGNCGTNGVYFNGVRGIGDPNRIFVSCAIDECGEIKFRVRTDESTLAPCQLPLTSTTEAFQYNLTAPVLNSVDNLSNEFTQSVLYRLNFSADTSQWQDSINIYRDGVLIDTIPSGSTFYDDSNNSDPTALPQPEDTYNYKVTANSNYTNCESDFSNTISASTDFLVLAPNLDPITRASLNGIYYQQIDWNYDPTIVTGYIIERSTSPTSGFVEIAKTGNITSFNDFEELVNGTTYYYRVKAINEDYLVEVESPYSNVSSIVYFYRVIPPTNFSADEIGFECIEFSFTENNTFNILVEIYYSVQVLQGGSGNNWITVDTISASDGSPFISCEFAPNTTYNIRLVGNTFGNPVINVWSGEIITVTTKAIGDDLNDVDDPFTVTDGTCGNNDCSIAINNYSSYFNDNPNFINIYEFVLTDIQGNIYSINSNGVFTGLNSGYYFLEAIPISQYIRTTYTARWIAATDTNTTVTVQESIVNHTDYSIRRTGQRWNSSATLTANQVGDWDVYRENPIQVGNQDATQSITINGLQPQYRYYYSFTSDADECKFLGSFYIKCEDGMTQGGIQKVFIAPWTTNSALIVDEKVSGFTESLTWYQLPTEPSNTFTQGYNRDVQGVFYNDILTIGVANDGFVDWDDVEFVLDKPWIVVFQDNNDNYWVFGHDNGAQSDVLSKNTGDFQENNAFTIGFADPHADGVLMALNKTYVEQNIL